MSTRSLRLLGVMVCTLVVSAVVENCAIAQGQVDDGTVTAIEIYRASDNQPINAGTVVGGIAGGVIGHQIGSGRGNTAATIAGTIGGAVTSAVVRGLAVTSQGPKCSVTAPAGDEGHRRLRTRPAREPENRETSSRAHS